MYVGVRSKYRKLFDHGLVRCAKRSERTIDGNARVQSILHNYHGCVGTAGGLYTKVSFGECRWRQDRNFMCSQVMPGDCEKKHLVAMVSESPSSQTSLVSKKQRQQYLERGLKAMQPSIHGASVCLSARKEVDLPTCTGPGSCFEKTFLSTYGNTLHELISLVQRSFMRIVQLRRTCVSFFVIFYFTDTRCDGFRKSGLKKSWVILERNKENRDGESVRKAASAIWMFKIPMHTRYGRKTWASLSKGP